MSQPLISLSFPTLRPFTIPQVLRTKTPGEGQEEECEEEEVEEETPKVCPREVADKRANRELCASCLSLL